MKKQIKLAFTDVPIGFDHTNNYYYQRIAKYFDVILSNKPDYIVDLCFGYEYLKHKYDNCVKIAITGENNIPDFSSFDYIGAHAYIEAGDRYCRMPIFCHWKGFEDLKDKKKCTKTDEELLNRDFCSFVVSNNWCADPMRENFFFELSKYKKVSSGGRFLNNVGGPVSSKLDFCSKFKFNIAFENSVSPGYTTEKIMEALAVDSVPIYYGNPLVGRDFNSEAFIHLKSVKDIRTAIDRIVYLDENDGEYLKVCKAEKFSDEVKRNLSCYDDDYDSFICNIFNQPLKDAYRVNRYGWESKYRREMQTYVSFYNCYVSRVFRKISKFVHLN